ncbi:nitroreductase family deazaflavin-dependent oxidoreductase [Streptomyces gardneri]|uniref:nitroreductase family deazaflavin-dependent oxidoreductase n=1 Tax=Nocardia TaxID=1817 RepID=UPI00135A765D|nr:MULTISPECIES: nitroreductase family deazaflavin-dependent oxidoreductase [Nocardia]MBF6169504.1 nitroreductase family deazaflavin-dependent oxidoreductase [Streptomyces gardneri]UAK32063.1 nitroreductase family deazaflavin-dependent oxidoreductase [Nocardia asteroides]
MPNRPRNLDSPLVAKLVKYMSKTQVWVYRRTKGRIGGRWRIGAGFRKPVPTLLLEHRGRKTGKLFTAPLLYLVDGDDLVVVASQGGLPRHPQWYFNLLAQPVTRVQIGAEHRRVRARVATPEERSRLWPDLVALYADFDTYQSWTQREIPVLILHPEDGAR